MLGGRWQHRREKPWERGWPSCDAVLLNRIRFNDHDIRVQAVEQRSRIVYLRDLPCEVPDDAVRAALRPFGEVHSLQKSCHDGFPGLFDGSRTVKMSLAKDIPPVLLVAGFECRIWYQPQNCPICRAPSVLRSVLLMVCVAAVASPDMSRVTVAVPGVLLCPSRVVGELLLPNTRLCLPLRLRLLVLHLSLPLRLRMLGLLLPMVMIDESDMDFQPAPVTDVDDSSDGAEMCSFSSSYSPFPSPFPEESRLCPVSAPGYCGPSSSGRSVISGHGSAGGG